MCTRISTRTCTPKYSKILLTLPLAIAVFRLCSYWEYQGGGDGMEGNFCLLSQQPTDGDDDNGESDANPNPNPNPDPNPNPSISELEKS